MSSFSLALVCVWEASQHFPIFVTGICYMSEYTSTESIVGPTSTMTAATAAEVLPSVGQIY